MKNYILYNTDAGNGDCRDNIGVLEFLYEDPEYIDVKKIVDYPLFISGLQQDDNLIICGGDGTLNRFVNNVGDNKINCKVYYYPIGTGNDFAHDLGKEKGSAPDFPINDYITSLPRVTVNGQDYRFINGVGYGIDGYCCEKGDALRSDLQAKKKKTVNYASIAVKGLLFHYKPTRATVTVDGRDYCFDKVWLAPTMYGSYYGGGMIPAPTQSRISPDKTVSLMVMYGTGKLRTLLMFPKIFDGQHVRYTDHVSVFSGHEITVSFDRPTPLQIDGETMLNVTSYTVRSGQDGQNFTYQAV